VTLIYFQRKLTGIYFTVSVRTPAFYSPFRGFHRAALSTRAETREQEARTWRIFYGKNGGPGSLSRFWPSEAATGTDVAGIGNTCHRKMHKLETRSCGGGREREREREIILRDRSSCREAGRFFRSCGLLARILMIRR